MSARFCILALAALLVTTLVIGYTIGSGSSVQQWLIQGMTQLKENGVTGKVLFVLAMIIVSTTGLLPSSIMAVAAGSIFGLWTGMVLVMSGIFIGGIIAFMLGRYLIRRPVHAWIEKRVSLNAIDRLIGERGWYFVALLRLSPFIPFTAGSYAFGISAVRLRDYCLGTVGVIPPLFAIVYTGALASDLATLYNSTFSEWNWAQYGMMITGLVASIAVAVILTRVATQALYSAQKKGTSPQVNPDPPPTSL